MGGGGRTRSTACGTARQRMGTITLRPLALQYTAHDAPAASPMTWPHLPRDFPSAHPCRKALSYTVQSTQRTAKAHRRRWQRRQRSWAERRRDRRQRRWLERRRERVARPCTVRKLLHLHRDWAHPCHICTGTGPPVLSAGTRNRTLLLACRLHGREGSHAAHPRWRQPHHCIAARTAHTRRSKQADGRGKRCSRRTFAARVDD